MIKLMFERNNQFFIITIDNQKIFYWDKLQSKIFGGPIQYLPPDPKLDYKISISRNRYAQNFKEMLRVTKEELEEFEKAKDDEEELKELVKRDCKKWGCKLVDTKIE